jgi:hypothetical protein
MIAHRRFTETSDDVYFDGRRGWVAVTAYEKDMRGQWRAGFVAGLMLCFFIFALILALTR